LAEAVEELLKKSQKWQVISPANLAIINFRYNPTAYALSEEELDALNQYISKQLIASREAVLVTTELHKKVVLRMCLINPKTTIKDIEETLNACEEFANKWLSER
jgi:glutamate/tyrosine decarboxylase-like PLP-dependent enzyme